MEINYKQLKRVTPQPYLFMVDIHVAEHCNFKCYSCSHFSSIAEEEYLDIEEFRKDITELSYLTKGYVHLFNLLGGEPLLNNDIVDYMKILRDQFDKSRINIITNGSKLLSMPDDFWKSVVEYDINIVVTKYHIKLPWDEMKAKAAEYGAKFEFFGTTETEPKSTYKFTMDETGSQNAYDNFINCFYANYCCRLKKGRLYTCQIASNAEHFNKKFGKNLEVTELDSIDIHKAKDYNEILQFLAKPIPFCRYCNLKEHKRLGDWRMGTGAIEEWT